MAMLKYKDPADGLWKPVPVGGSAGVVPNEVTIDPAQPTDGSELWLDTDEPVTSLDTYTKAEVDAGFVPVTGGGMSGPLMVPVPTLITQVGRWAEGTPRFATVAERDAAYAGIGGPSPGMECWIINAEPRLSYKTMWNGSVWALIHGDTGWLDISSLLINGWSVSSGYVYLRRIGLLCWLKLYSVIAPATANPIFMVAPTGFAPATSTLPVLTTDPSTIYVDNYVFLTSTNWNINGTMASGKVVRSITSYMCDVDWPTVLPGVPFLLKAEDEVVD